MRKLLLSLLLLLGVATQAADTAPIPETLVRNTSRDVLDTIKKENLGPGDHRMLEVVETKALPYFDFTKTTRLAVGMYWKDATADQRTALVREFKTLLIRTYSAALTAKPVQSIEVKPVKMADGDTDVTVRTEVTAGGSPFSIDYRMAKSGSDWKVYDVSVEGASLVTTYRDNFGKTIQKDGIDGLIKALIERNASGSTAKPAAAN